MSEIIPLSEFYTMSNNELVRNYRLAEDTAENCIKYMREIDKELQRRRALHPDDDIA